MKKGLLIIVSILISNVYSYSQCVLTPTVNVSSIDCGDTAIITLVSASAFECDFNFGICTGWDTTSSAQLNASCGGIPPPLLNQFLPNGGSPDYLWMGNLADVPRTLTTTFLNLVLNDSIWFDIVYATQSSGCSNAEGPDLSEEGVSLQYSIDTGTTWVDIAYYMPDGQVLVSNPGPSYMPFTPVTGAGTSMTVWNHIGIATPLLAKVNGVKVRWIQEYSSNIDFDHWGLDNIFFPTPPNLNVYFGDSTFINTSLIGLANDTTFTGQIAVSPLSDTTYSFFGTSFYGDTCFATLDLNVNSTSLGSDILYDCNQNFVQLQALGVSIYADFSWTPTTTMSDSTILNPTVNPLDTTEYIVTSSCGSDTISVNVISNYVFSVSDDAAICIGDSVVLEVFGGAQTYAWTPNDGSISDTSIRNPYFSPLTTTTYTVVCDSVGCIKTETITVHVSNKKFSFVLPTAANCSGAPTGTILSFANGFIGPFNYDLYNGTTTINQPSGVFSNLFSGVYTITANDSMGCPVDTTITVGGGYQASIDSVTTISPFCVGANNGSLEVFIDTTLAVEYSIDSGITYQTSPVFNSITSGTYYVFVKDGTCTALQTVVISAPASIQINLLDSTDVSCGGGSDGEIQVNASNGTIPYEYSLDNVTFLNNSGVFTSLSAGNHTVFVKDVNGCKDSLVTDLTEPLALVLSVTTSNNLTCNNNASGLIELSVVNGSIPYQYSIDSGATFSNSNSFSTLNANNYILIAQDDNGCLSNVLYDTLTEPSLLVITEDSVKSSSCGNADAIIYVSASGGNSGYMFGINGGALQVSGIFPGLTSGVHTVLLNDANGCDSTINITVADIGAPSLYITFSDSISCLGFTDAEVHLTAIGGVQPYTYSIDNGITFVTDTFFMNIGGGIQNFIVKDDIGCQGTADTTVYSLPALIINTTQDSVFCNGGNNGEIHISASAGTAPYTYAINDTSTAGTSPNFAGHTAGNYTGYVIDDNGCVASNIQTVYEPLVLNLLSIQDSVSCFNGNDGEITLSANGGNSSSAYSYAINDINTTQSSPIFSGLENGNNSIYVIDAKGCIDSLVQEVLEPDTFIMNTIPIDISCSSSGSITVNAQGGTSPYAYSLNSGTSQSSNVFNITLGGIYTVEVSDVNCPTISTVDTIVAPGAVTFVIDSIIDTTNCNGNSDAYISILESGGTGPYDYSINGGTNYQSSNEFLVSAGIYTLEVKDVFGCTSTQTMVSIYEPNALSATTSSNGVSCFGYGDGAITINSILGGNAPYSVSVNGSTSNYNSGLVFNSLSAGTYTISILDDNNCNLDVTETVGDVTALNLVIDNLENVSCFGEADGEITVSVLGGVPVYTFDLDLGSVTTTIVSNSSASFTNLAGSETGIDYQLTITDANGCPQTFIQTITEPNQLSIDSMLTDSLSCFGAMDAALQVFATGGSLPYIYSWEPGFSNTSVLTGLSPSTYTVTVEDANGCVQRLTEIITPVDPIIATISPDTAFISMGDSFQLNVNVQNADSNLSYNWSPSNGLSCTDCASPFVTVYNDIEYSVVVTSENGCTNNNFNEIFVIVNPALFYFIPNGFSPNGDGFNDNFQVYGQDIKAVNMKVYNRWGEKIFEGVKQSDFWDGTFNNVAQGSGSYSYDIEIEFLNSEKVIKKGSVNILK